MRRTAEFDAFGPWIYEVTTDEDVPGLYRDHPVDLATALLVLKVPRPIWRRDANPGMDLYDHLVIAGPDALTVLSRRGTSYRTTVIDHDRLGAVHASVSLLDGLFQVRAVDTPGIAVDVHYNGVSHALVEQLVRVLRAQVAPPEAEGGAPSGIELDLRDLGGDDVALVATLRELVRHDPTIVPVATHRRIGVTRTGGVAQSVLDWLRPGTLHATVVARSPGELHLVHRRDWFAIGRGPVHSVAHTVVVTPRVTGVADLDVSRYDAVRAVQITSGNSVLDVPYPEGADSGRVVRAVAEAGAMA